MLRNFRELTKEKPQNEVEPIIIEDATNEIIIMRSKVSRILNEIAEKRANR